jgi:hypothetical protein
MYLRLVTWFNNSKFNLLKLPFKKQTRSDHHSKIRGRDDTDR